MTGCSSQKDDDMIKEDEMPKEVKITMDLLEEKYGETFEVKKVGQRWGTLVKDTFKAIVAPTSDPTLVFEATVDKEGSYIMDGYMTEIALRNIKTILDKDIQNVFQDAFVEINSGIQIFEVVDDLSAESFVINYPKALFAAYIYIPEEKLNLQNFDTIKTVIEAFQNSIQLNEVNLFIVPYTSENKDAIFMYQLENANHESGFNDIIDESKRLKIQIIKGRYNDYEDDLRNYLK